MKLFIDTNIFLGFYHLTTDDLEELRKLSVLIKNEEIILYLPEQVVREFRRSRETKLSDAIDRFEKETLNNQFPQICKEYEEYDDMREAIKDYKKAKSKLKEKLINDISKIELKADEVIQELFDKAEYIETTFKLFVLAKRRYQLGDPPGKKGSYGDALNWVALLNSVPKKSDLYFITGDGDYLSSLNKEKFSAFLAEEWKSEKEGEIHFYKRLSMFFKEQFPHINLASELEKALLIRDLSASPNFATTRMTLKKLSKFTEFTTEEVRSIVDAAISNNQIYWIMRDTDINYYLSNIIRGFEDDIDGKSLYEFQKHLGTFSKKKAEENSSSEFEASDDDDIPF